MSEIVSEPARKRGVGRGSRFFVLDRELWEAIWQAPTLNRLNFVTAFLVLLAGTGADHRLTKWSAKACEERAGMGKPRAKKAIEELIAAKLLERTEASTPMFPQYRIAEGRSTEEPIFLPVQLVTGFGPETPILRRVRETGDAMVLRMLVDLYGLIEPDATYGVPLSTLRLFSKSDDPSRKAFETGVHAVWSLELGTWMQGEGKWRNCHSSASEEEPFWPRVNKLQNMGALWFEPWVFGGTEWDSEPLFPVDLAEVSGNKSPVSDRDTQTLTSLCMQVGSVLAGDRTYLLSESDSRLFVALPIHHGAPALRGVARMRVEPDTPGRRLSYAARKKKVYNRSSAYRKLLEDASVGDFSQPLQ